MSTPDIVVSLIEAERRRFGKRVPEWMSMLDTVLQEIRLSCYRHAESVGSENLVDASDVHTALTDAINKVLATFTPEATHVTDEKPPELARSTADEPIRLLGPVRDGGIMPFIAPDSEAIRMTPELDAELDEQLPKFPRLWNQIARLADLALLLEQAKSAENLASATKALSAGAVPAEVPQAGPDIKQKRFRRPVGIALIAAAGVLLTIGGIVISQLDDGNPVQAEIPTLPLSVEEFDICPPDTVEATLPSASVVVAPTLPPTPLERSGRATKRKTAKVKLTSNMKVRVDGRNGKSVTLSVTAPESVNVDYQVGLAPGMGIEMITDEVLGGDILVTVEDLGER